MKNTTKLSAAALFSALVLGGTFATNVVSADALNTAQGADVNSVAAIGHAYVTFTKTGTNPVHDPSDPGKTIEPSNPGDKTGQTGELTLDAIPSQLNFGTQEAEGAGQVVQLLASNATADTDDRANSQGDDKSTSDQQGKTDRVIFTQVTNVATTKPTWTLSATMGDFVNTTDKSTLPDAFITFGGGVNVLDKYTAATTDAKGNKVAALQEWAPAADALKTDQILTAGKGSTEFVSSAETGTFQQQWNVKDVTLTTPQAPSKGDFTSEINWTLTAAPAAITNTPDETNPEGGA